MAQSFSSHLIFPNSPSSIILGILAKNFGETWRNHPTWSNLHAPKLPTSLCAGWRSAQAKLPGERPQAGVWCCSWINKSRWNGGFTMFYSSGVVIFIFINLAPFLAEHCSMDWRSLKDDWRMIWGQPNQLWGQILFLQFKARRNSSSSSQLSQAQIGEQAARTWIRPDMPCANSRIYSTCACTHVYKCIYI